MSLYYLFWAMLIGASLWISLGGFLWAHRSGQFRDQERARFLPLRGEKAPSGPEQDRPIGIHMIAMLTVLALGVAAMLTVLAVVLLRAGGGTP